MYQTVNSFTGLRCSCTPARVGGRRIAQPCAGPPGKEPSPSRTPSACPTLRGAASLRKGIPRPHRRAATRRRSQRRTASAPGCCHELHELSRRTQYQPALAGFGVSDREFIHGAAEESSNLAQARRVRGLRRGGRCRLARRFGQQPACARGFHVPLAGPRRDDDLRGARHPRQAAATNYTN